MALCACVTLFHFGIAAFYTGKVRVENDNQPHQGLVNPSVLLSQGLGPMSFLRVHATVWDLKEHKEKLQIKINKCLIKELQNVTLCQLH